MKKTFVVIFLTVLTSMISIAAFNPILGPLTRNLGLTEIESGSLVTITGMCWIAGSFLWGKWARQHRKPLMIAALLGYAATVAVFAWLADAAGQREWGHSLTLYASFLGLRALAGFFFGAIPAIAQSYLMDWTTADNRVGGMALFGAANGLGFVLGPAMGAAFAPVGLTVPMYVSAALIVLMAPVFGAMAASPARTTNVKTASVRLSPFDPRIRRYLAIGLVLSTLMVLLQVTAGFYLQDRLSVSAQQAARMLGIALTIAGLIVVAAQIGISRYLRHRNPVRFLQIGLGALGAGFLAFMAEPASCSLAFAILGIGIGFTLPGYMTAASVAVSESEQTGVASFAAAVQGVGSFIGPVAGTALYAVRGELPYLAGIAVTAFLFVLVSRQAGRRSGECG